MANGQELGKENVEKFKSWCASQTDDDFREMVHEGKLKRRTIVKGCGFGSSVLRQNPTIKDHLEKLEKTLRDRGVLPPPKKKNPSPDNEPQELDQAQIKRDKQGLHLSRVEQEVVELRARVADLEKEKAELERKLERFEALGSALADVGRLPR